MNTMEMENCDFKRAVFDAVEVIFDVHHRNDSLKIPFSSGDISAFVSSSNPLGLENGSLFTDMPRVTDILLAGHNSNHRGHMGDIPGGGLLLSSIGEFITSALNRWPGLYEAAPAMIEVERFVLTWLCQLFGFSDAAGGVFTSGGSIANLSAVCTARAIKLGGRVGKGIVYTSDQAHHSVRKAAKVAGFPDAQIRVIESSDDGTISTSKLRQQIQFDSDAGFDPFLIVSSAGTTRTGAFDDLMELNEIKNEYGMWLHVDAAWAGSFILTDQGRSLMEGIENADSITIDPHKAFWTNWGVGALLVKDVKHLHLTFAVDEDYLPFEDAGNPMLNPSLLSLELSRGARGLQLWLPLKYYGVGAFQSALNEKLSLSRRLMDELSARGYAEILHQRSLGLVLFSLSGKSFVGRDIDSENRRLISIVNESGEIYISGVNFKGRYYIRIAPLHFRTHIADIERVIALIDSGVTEMLSSLQQLDLQANV